MNEQAKKRVQEVLDEMEVTVDEKKLTEIAILLEEVDNYDGDYSDEQVREAIDFVGLTDEELWG